MSSTQKAERCDLCDNLTGKGGKADDSLYCAAQGPFCDGCHTCVSAAVDVALERAAMVLDEVALKRSARWHDFDDCSGHYTAGVLAVEVRAMKTTAPKEPA